MSQEISTNVFGGSVSIADVKGLAERAQQAAQNDPRGGAPDGSDYLNFSGKRGLFTIGADKREVQPDEIWIVDVTSFEEGWVAWKNNQPVGVRMANIYKGAPISQPDADDLGPFPKDGEGWFQAKAMVMKSLDNDQQGYFRINSISGVSEMAKLMGEFAERASTGEPHWPVIQLTKEEFTAQGFKNFKPIFDRVGWIDDEQLQAVAGGADIDDVLEGQAEAEAPVDDPKPEPKEEKPKAARSRRRASR